MKPWQIGAAIVGVGLAVTGISAAVTNPSPEDYEEYAVKQLAVVLTDECQEWAQKDKESEDGLTKFLKGALQSGCPQLVDSSRPLLKTVVAENTQRQNYLFLSIYRTKLSVDEVIPVSGAIPGLQNYELEAETIGIFRQLVTFKAQQS